MSKMPCLGIFNGFLYNLNTLTDSIAMSSVSVRVQKDDVHVCLFPNLEFCYNVDYTEKRGRVGDI